MWLRVGARAVSLSALTLVCLQIWLVGLVFIVGSPRTRVRWRNANFRGWSRGALRVLGVRVEVRGSPPTAPFLLVSNHLSYVDVALLGSRVKGAFVAKQEVSRWPIVGTLSRWMQTVFIDRSSRRAIQSALEQIDELMASGQGVLLFPEGTSSPGASVLPFHSSLLALAAAKRIPVSHVALSYDTPAGEEPAHLSVCWWGDMTLMGHIAHLLALSRFRAQLVFGEAAVCDGDRKRLARTLRDAVASDFTPVVAMEERCA